LYFTGLAATPGNIAAIKSKFNSVKPDFGNMRSILKFFEPTWRHGHQYNESIAWL